MRLVFVAVVLAFVCPGCSGSSTGPSETSVAGRWEGTFTVEACSVSGMSTNCHSLPPGVAEPVVLVLGQDGAQVFGQAVLRELNPRAAPDFYHRFSTTLEPSGRLRFSSGWGRSPSAVMKLDWDLQLLGGDRLQGTLTATHTWYKVAGAITSTGPTAATRVSR